MFGLLEQPVPFLDFSFFFMIFIKLNFIMADAVFQPE